MNRPIKIQEFDLAKVKLSEFKQFHNLEIASISYKDDDQQRPAIFKTEQMVAYRNWTISPFNEALNENCNIRHYLNPKFLGYQSLRTMLLELDNFFGNKDNHPKIFGQRWQNIKKYKFAYSHLVHNPENNNENMDDDDDDKEESKLKKAQRDYCYLKFLRDFDTKEINTGVFIKEKGKVKNLEIKKPLDLVEHYKVGDKVRFILIINNVWLVKSQFNTYRYGVSVKVLQMEIEPVPQLIKYDKQYAFESDEEGEWEGEGEEPTCTINFDFEKDGSTWEEEVEDIDSDEEEELVHKLLVDI